MSDPDRQLPLPAIHPTDHEKKRVDVRVEPHQSALVLGEDLVLWWGPEPAHDHNPRAGRTRYTGRWLVGVCDASANHLHHLAVTQGPPSDAVIAAAIQTARLAYPTYFEIPPGEKALADIRNEPLARGAQRFRRVAERQDTEQ